MDCPVQAVRPCWDSSVERTAPPDLPLDCPVQTARPCWDSSVERTAPPLDLPLDCPVQTARPCWDSSVERTAPLELNSTAGRRVVCGATRGVTVSMSAFLVCHQCYCAGSSLDWGLNLWGCSMWHFLKLVARGFLRVLRFPPFLHRFNGSANEIKLK